MHDLSHRSIRGAPRRRVAWLMTAVLACSAVVGNGSVAAADSADIPGIPMPGPVAAGRLGGAIYDVVYRLSVSPGYVIVASVTGTPGTDFDLYLFDSSATTVLSTTGLLTKSNGPDSSESVSWPSQFGGTYYIDLNGATDVEGDYRLTVQALPDPTPPQTSILLAGGRTATNQLTVPVTLTASDDLSGVVAMALSDDGVTFGAWQAFQAATTWTFESGDGPRRLWAKVRNGVGLESPVASATITLDTVQPQIAALDPLPGSRVAGLRPTIEVTFNEPIDPRTWLDLGLVIQQANGVLVAGSYTFDPATRIGSFTPFSNLLAGGLYVVTVGNVTDVAGNHVGSIGSWSVTPLIPTTLSVAASPAVIVTGGATKIDLEIGGAPLPAVLAAESVTAKEGVTPMSPISIEDGTNSVVVAPKTNTTYRFQYRGTSSVSSAQSETRVLVRRTAVLVGKDSRVVSRGKVGVPVRLLAGTTPAAAGLSVSFRLFRFDASRRVWIYAGSKGRNTDSAGRATLTWTPSASGSYYWRLAVPSTVDLANNMSPVYRWTVSR
jgi:Bacterial Ig-like domain